VATIQGGTGSTLIYGADGGAVTYFGAAGSQAGATFVAASGNETLNAGTSSTNNTFYAGSGSATISGGSGADNFLFFAERTAGTGRTDIITDFDTRDTLFLSGYDSTQSAASILHNAQITAAGVTLSLSDGTKVTFSNLHDTSELSGRTSYT
jgi:hypothetical protein